MAPDASIVIPTIREDSPTLDTLEELDTDGLEVIVRRDPESLNVARNRGVEEAESDHILLFDDDIRFDQDWLDARVEQVKRSADEQTIWAVRAEGIFTAADWSDSHFSPIMGRVMVFDRQTWLDADGFPDPLHHGGDTVFALNAAQAGWDVVQLPHEFVHDDEESSFTTSEHLQWLYRLTATAPEIVVPKLPSILGQAVRNRL